MKVAAVTLQQVHSYNNTHSPHIRCLINCGKSTITYRTSLTGVFGVDQLPHADFVLVYKITQTLSVLSVQVRTHSFHLSQDHQAEDCLSDVMLNYYLIIIISATNLQQQWTFLYVKKYFNCAIIHVMFIK